MLKDDAWMAESRELRAEIERLRAALKPFADWIANRDVNPATSGYTDDCRLAYYPDGPNAGAATVGDLRRAHAALGQCEAKPSPGYMTPEEVAADKTVLGPTNKFTRR